MIAHVDRLDRALGDAVAGNRVPGITAAVVADGAVRDVDAAGLADARTRAALTPETALLWFSMTKIVTATAAMRLVDERRLSLADEVDDLVPGVLPAGGGRVLVRHLLQHSAGIPVRPADVPAPDPAVFLLERFARVRKLRFAPGSRAAYTNLGCLLLGEVIAAASGRPFTDYVTEQILSPLQMHATSFGVLESGSAGCATGHQRLPLGLGPVVKAVLPPGITGPRAGRWLTFQPFLVNGAAYGGLVGPVTDAARLVLAHANGGALDGVRVISESATSAMQEISLEGRPFDHGLGWFRPPADRGRHPGFVEHYGGGGGYRDLMRLYPDRRVGVVVMGNSTSYDVDAVADAIAEPWLD